MLTLSQFPQVPRLQAIESRFTIVPTVMQRAIIVAFTCMAHQRKDVKTIAQLTQYSEGSRLTQAVVSAFLNSGYQIEPAGHINDLPAYRVGQCDFPNQQYFHDHTDSEEKRIDLLLFREVLRNVARRASVNRRRQAL